MRVKTAAELWRKHGNYVFLNSWCCTRCFLNAPGTITTLLKHFPTLSLSRCNEWHTVHWHYSTVTLYPLSFTSPILIWFLQVLVVQQVFFAGGPILVDNLEEMINLIFDPVLASYLFFKVFFNSLLFSPPAISLIMLCKYSKHLPLKAVFLHLYNSYLNSQGLQCHGHIDSSWIFTCPFDPFLSYLHPRMHYSSMIAIWTLLSI